MPELRGPGLYNASRAVISSNFVGFNLFIRSRIPEDSNWKTAIVFPDDSNLKTLSSFNGIDSMSNFFASSLSRLIDFTARSITVRVLNPKKSNFTNPIFSTSSLSYWVITDEDWRSTYTGQKSEMLPGAITTPPACLPTFLAIPSNLYDKSTISLTSESFLIVWANIGCSIFALSSVIPGANGIILEILSPSAYGLPIALATSLTTALAAIVPKVAICDTAPDPYLLLT